jgi:hypothetical protein
MGCEALVCSTGHGSSCLDRYHPLHKVIIDVESTEPPQVPELPLELLVKLPVILHNIPGTDQTPHTFPNPLPLPQPRSIPQHTRVPHPTYCTTLRFGVCLRGSRHVIRVDYP